uniref:Uncharacterized protein n=1 Tax=Pseudictyota dubia TaxID=2749911 RepID=A0A7R9WB48_9STRA|mmetsp:Transcript_42235/g.78194  ORF Transcript_42235/g.78194 Transcript_42235/m.78194 type:complete len:200 (+) Transcript_42235:82-681(+)
MCSFKFVMAVVLLIALPPIPCAGFSPLLPTSKYSTKASAIRREVFPLEAVFIGGLFGKKETADPNAPKRIFDVPCEAGTVKVGGLRFALGLHLIGQQGNPEKGTWLANQADDGVLDMFFKDKTGMFSVTLDENSISVDRYGPRPSLQYLLQESVVLHDLLDELNSLAFEGDDIEDENRLLRPKGDAIEKSRETLPARKA